MCVIVCYAVVCACQANLDLDETLKQWKQRAQIMTLLRPPVTNQSWGRRANPAHDDEELL